MAISQEIKASVMSALMTGQSINSVAREYNLPKSTVSRWKNEGVSQNGTQKKEIGTLLLEYLTANLIALREQLIVFSDQTWLKKNSAENLAVLHGVMTDKAIRLLEAMSKLGGDDENSPSED